MALLDTFVSLLSEQDLYLFNEGSHTNLYDKLGAHCGTVEGVAATPPANTASVAISAKMNASGTQRSDHAVSASARRAT